VRQPTAQVAPFSVKDVGAVLVPEWEPLKPMSTDAPGASVPFHAALVAVTLVPDCDQVALQPCWTVCPLANVNRRFHPFSAVVPLLVTRTEAVKPEFQLLAVYLTVHAPVDVGVGVGVGVTVGVGVGVGVTVGVGVGVGVTVGVGVGVGVTVGVGVGVVPSLSNRRW
jgi:hypothetical protein